MAARSKARKRAVDILYEADLRGGDRVELPVTMELVVQHTDPGLQGDRSTGGTKPATLETGAQIQVPLFVNTGDKLKVDTRDGRYLGRAN